MMNAMNSAGTPASELVPLVCRVGVGKVKRFFGHISFATIRTEYNMSAASILQELGLRQDAVKALKRKARERGKTTPEYLRALIESDLLAEKTFDQVLAPIREGFRKSRLTERELDELLDRARRASRRRRPKVSRR
jgi:hypothetical protein